MMPQALMRLSGRERLLVAACAVTVAVLMAWQFAWVPIQAERAALRADIARYIALSEVAASAQPKEGVGTVGASRLPMSQAVTQSARRFELSLARIEPRQDRLALSLPEASFNQLIKWLSHLEIEGGIVPVSVEIERSMAPGVVDARLVLKEY